MLDKAMDAPSRTHKARVPRPHLAQEFVDNKQEEHAESVTFALMPHARRCARGEVRSHVKVRVESARDKMLKDHAKRDVRAAWDLVDAGIA